MTEKEIIIAGIDREARKEVERIWSKIEGLNERTKRQTKQIKEQEKRIKVLEKEE